MSKSLVTRKGNKSQLIDTEAASVFTTEWSCVWSSLNQINTSSVAELYLTRWPNGATHGKRLVSYLCLMSFGWMKPSQLAKCSNSDSGGSRISRRYGRGDPDRRHQIIYQWRIYMIKFRTFWPNNWLAPHFQVGAPLGNPGSAAVHFL